MKDRKLLSICLLFLVIGFLAVHLGGKYFLKELKPSQAEQYLSQGDSVSLTGQVYKKEQASDYQILYLKNNSIIQKDNLLKQPLKESRLIIYDKNNIKVKPGNTVHAEGELSFFEQARNPGNFDSRFYYQRQNIRVRIWSSELLASGKSWRIQTGLWNLKDRLKKVMEKALGRENAGILGAMLLGDRAGMDKDVKELYQKNGIAHVLAISGLHLSFIGISIYRMFRRASGSYAAGGICGIFFLMFYILMIGFSVSAVRALVMFLFRVGADMAGRHYDAPTALSVSAVVVIIWRPLSFYDGGFWLSFGAVLGIIAIFPVFRNLPAQGLWAGISINVMILPVLLYCFFEFPPYSLLLNLAVIPLMSVLLAMGMAGCALSFLMWPAACLFLEGCKMILDLYEWLCEIVLNLPGSVVVTGQPPIAGIIFYYMTVFTAWQIWKKKDILTMRRAAYSTAVILSGCFVLLMSGKPGNALTVTVLDVGQGDCIFIRDAAGPSCLVDGGSSDIKSVGKYRIEPYLKYQGIKTLDYVFVSHGDSDHMNGIEEMVEGQKTGVQIKTLVLPVSSVWDKSLNALAVKAADEGIKVVTAEPGVILKDGGLTIECLQPGEDYRGKTGNAASMVLAAGYGEFDMLLTGDVEEEGEEMLAEHLKEKYKDCSWEVLKAAHHGSKNSTKEKFLKELEPMYTVISSGVDNRYGHPHPETLKRLKDAGSSVYSTQEQGAVTLKVKENRLTVSPYLK